MVVSFIEAIPQNQLLVCVFSGMSKKKRVRKVFSTRKTWEWGFWPSHELFGQEMEFAVEIHVSGVVNVNEV